MSKNVNISIYSLTSEGLPDGLDEIVSLGGSDDAKEGLPDGLDESVSLGGSDDAKDGF